MNIKEIKNLIKFVSLSNISEVKLKLREFKITIKTDNKKGSTRVNSPTLSKDELLSIADENFSDQNQEDSASLDEKKSNLSLIHI